MSETIHIETIDTIEKCYAHQEVQIAIWGRGNQIVVPVTMLIALARNGGVVLGAYVEGIMAGILLGTPGMHEGRAIHLSHMLGIHPNYRRSGLGRALKWRQREIVLSQGIDTMKWTYDPLQAINARFNLRQLGATVDTYTRDYYGNMQDPLNEGIASDRFIITWDLKAPQVQERMIDPQKQNSIASIKLCLDSKVGAANFRQPGRFVPPSASDKAVLVEIPLSILSIKDYSADLATDWRKSTRTAFEYLFAQSFVAMDFYTFQDRAFYYLEKGDRS